MQWYYSKNSTQLGPVADAELKAKLASREVAATDMVWREGMIDWVPVSTLPELVAVIQAGGNPAGVPGSPYAPPMIPGAVQNFAPPTSGLAIASLVCGILGLVTCLFLPGIPAVICGHMALRRMDDPMRPQGGRGMAIAGLVTGYLSVAFVLFSLLMFVMTAFVH